MAKKKSLHKRADAKKKTLNKTIEPNKFGQIDIHLCCQDKNYILRGSSKMLLLFSFLIGNLYKQRPDPELITICKMVDTRIQSKKKKNWNI